MSKLSHIDDQGEARMVDVGDKADSPRIAVADGRVTMKPETLALIQAGNIKKGDVLATARIAGIMAAKRTSDLVPLCHPLPLTSVKVELTLDDTLPGIKIRATAKVTGKTGVEMEALTAVSVAALTIYDMAKAVDREMEIGEIKLIHKSGGKSGDFDQASDADPALKSKATPGLRSKSLKLVPHAVVQEGPSVHAQNTPVAQREALRRFIRTHQLKVHDWATEADVRPGEVFSFLNGQSVRLSEETAAKLASSLGLTPNQLFGQ